MACPPGNYLLSSYDIAKTKYIKFFSKFKEKTFQFQKAKLVCFASSACALQADGDNCKIFLLKRSILVAGLNKIERRFNRLILIKINLIDP